MKKMWVKIFTTAALVSMLCLAGLILSGTAFADRCVDNGDGTVTDNYSRLMWQKATAGPMDWSAAMSYASGLSLGGHSDWWLPSRDELSGLFQSPCKNMMEVVSSSYWSSTNHVRSTIHAWRVYFNLHHGLVLITSKSLTYYVRAVRSAQ